ncbi:tyrosine-type recombinase/integrase [Barnesiella viscericola]|uniref:Tyrosine recombinase XerC n=1 Tax=Barnesiella viscericola TaxID=397865 RepID=A0A921MRB0_9BACT|nr:tyrosine-type recombinase/integrase [Barnesiella viscericola]HJG88870.1 tyrosine-type recombinase/integrase [Barnesiella viscericola]
MLAESFLRYIRYEKNLSTHTVLSYKNDLFQFKEFLETIAPGCELQQVTPEQVREWIATLSESGLSARTVSRKVSSLRSFYRYLITQSVVTGSPVKEVRVPKVRKKLPVYLRRDTMDELLDDVEYGDDFEGVRNKLIIEMFYNTGIRRAELIGLHDDDVRAEEIKVTGKRNKQRLVPYGPELAALIADYRKARREAGFAHTDYFFIKKDGEPLYPQLVYRVVKQALSQVCTLEKKSPHVLRHTFASVMLNNGAGLNSVKELLGHHSLASTEVYTHITFEELKQSYNQAFPKRKP